MIQQPLPPSDPAELDLLNRTVRSPLNVSDFPGWEDVLKKSNILELMRTEFQRRNDCQGQTLCAGAEAREGKLTKREPVQRSDTFAYQCCELIDVGQVGRDIGTTITSGVKLLTEGVPRFNIQPGIVAEEDWPYDMYDSTKRSFPRGTERIERMDSHLVEHRAIPDFETTLVAFAANGTCHIGTYWEPRWVTAGNGMMEMAQAPLRGGGHATCPMHAIQVAGVWKIFVWNSHGRGRHYLIGERTWNALVDNGFRPFGGFLLMPDKPEERYSDARLMDGRIWV